MNYASVHDKNDDMYDGSGWVKVRHTYFSKRKVWFMRLLGSTLSLHQSMRDATALEYSVIGCKVLSGLLPLCFTLKLSDGCKLRISCDSRKEAREWKEVLLCASNEIFEDQFELLNPIGENDGTELFKAKDLLDHSRVMVQRIARDPFDALSFENTQDLCRRLYAVQNLGHHNFLWALSTFHEADYAYIISRRLSGKKLSQVMTERGGRLCESETRDIAKQMVEAISYMHIKGYALRNLTLDSIWYDDSEGSDGRITITDFRNVAFVYDEEDHRMRGAVGDVRYHAPEILKGRSYTAAVDMFSLGVCVYQMLCGSLPFTSDEERKSQVIEDREQKLKFGESEWTNISREAKQFVSSLLRACGIARMKACDAEAHPWLEMVIPETGKGSEAAVENMTPVGGKKLESGKSPRRMVKVSRVYDFSFLLKRDENKFSPFMRRFLRPLSRKVPLSVRSAVRKVARIMKR